MFGSPGHPVWNLLHIYQREPVKAHPAVARGLGAFLVLVGGFALYRVVLEWLSLAAR